MNDEKHTPSEDWEMSVPSVSPPETEVENKGDGWKMPEPVFRVSEGDKVEKSEVKSLVAEDALPTDFPTQEESFVLAQPSISEEFNTSEFSEPPTYEAKPESINAENGNAKWVILLGGIFIFFAVLVAIMLSVYFFFWKG